MSEFLLGDVHMRQRQRGLLTEVEKDRLAPQGGMGRYRIGVWFAQMLRRIRFHASAGTLLLRQATEARGTAPTMQDCTEPC
jgi:hypothetical protein